MFLGPLQERSDVRIVSTLVGWYLAAPDLAVADSGSPRWENIAVARGPTWTPLW